MHLNVCPFLPFADGSSEGEKVCTKLKLRTECSDQTGFWQAKLFVRFRSNVWWCVPI